MCRRCRCTTADKRASLQPHRRVARPLREARLATPMLPPLPARIHRQCIPPASDMNVLGGTPMCLRYRCTTADKRAYLQPHRRVAWRGRQSRASPSIRSGSLSCRPLSTMVNWRRLFANSKARHWPRGHIEMTKGSTTADMEQKRTAKMK